MAGATVVNGPGLCACGCGSTTTIAQKTDARAGVRKGERLRYVRGHNSQRTRRSAPAATIIHEPWTDDELLDEWVWVRDTCWREEFPRRARVGVKRWQVVLSRAKHAGDPRAEFGRADRDRLDEAETRTHPARAARGRAA